MRKNIFLLSLLILAPLMSCTSKKGQLSENTLVITIDPPEKIVQKQSQTSYKAVFKSATGTNMDIDVTPEWLVENGSLGGFSPAKGKSVTFVANQTLGTTKVYCQYGGVRAQGQVTVSDIVPDSTVPSKEFIVFKEIPASANPTTLLLDVKNPPNIYGGGVFISVWPSTGTLPTLSEATTSLGVDHTEGAKGLRLDIGNDVGGIWFQFGSDGTTIPTAAIPTDLSSFANAKLVFDVKTPYDLKFGVSYQGGGLEANDQLMNYISLDGNWHTISVPIKSLPGGNFVKFDQIKQLFHIGSSATPPNKNFTFYVDNIRWEVD